MKKLLCLLLLLPLIAACGKGGNPDVTSSPTGDTSSVPPATSEVSEPALYDIVLFDCRGGSVKEHIWTASSEELTPENMVAQLCVLLGLTLDDASNTTVKIESDRIIINGLISSIFSSDTAYADGVYDSFAKTFRHNYGEEKSVYFTMGNAEPSAPYVYSWDRTNNPAPVETTTSSPVVEGELSQADAIEYALNLAREEFGEEMELTAEAAGLVTVENIRCYVVKVYQPGSPMPLRQFAIGVNNERVYQYSHYQQKYIPY